MLCSLRCLPELAEATAAPAVSFCVVSPSPLARFLPLTSMPVGAESSSPPAMSPPWPPLPRAATEHTCVLSAPPGGRSTPPCLLACSPTPKPSAPELRPPRSSSSPSPPATPGPTGATARRALVWALERAQPRCERGTTARARVPRRVWPRRRHDAGGFDPA